MKIVLSLLGLLIMTSAVGTKIIRVRLLQRPRLRRRDKSQLHKISAMHGDGERHRRVLSAQQYVCAAAWTASLPRPYRYPY